MPALQVIPAILANDRKELTKKLLQVKKCAFVQVDIGDGLFVKNKTIQLIDFVGIKNTPRIEFHLMVNDIDHYIEHCIMLNAKTIIFHFEACKNVAEILHLIRHIKDHNMNVGIAINPETSISRIKQFIKKVDQVTIMSVHPGFGGRKFIPQMVKKIEALRKLDKKINIEVDGGINGKTALIAAKAGANMFAVGSAIFDKKNVYGAIEKILSAVKR